jgi:HlyD family secretion protein
MYKYSILFLLIILVSCKDKREKTSPVLKTITESVYASGAVKSNQQYQILAGVNGKIEKIFVAEGQEVEAGTKLFLMSNSIQQYTENNAKLNAENASLAANQSRLVEVEQQVNWQFNKLKLDSSLYYRQLALFKQQVGSQLELEQKELNYQNAKTAYLSAKVRRDELAKLIKLQAKQSVNNLKISQQQASDFEVKSLFKGTIYQINKKVGEVVTAQTPIGLIGDSRLFTLEMQVDENDIFKINLNQEVLITMDSYKGEVFKAIVNRISPIMNDKNKTFLVEADFTVGPPKVYPNITFEANILVQRKEKALLIPRNYLINDSMVVKENGEQVLVQTGLKDLQMVEILSGLNEADVIVKP